MSGKSATIILLVTLGAAAFGGLAGGLPGAAAGFALGLFGSLALVY